MRHREPITVSMQRHRNTSHTHTSTHTDIHTPFFLGLCSLILRAQGVFFCVQASWQYIVSGEDVGGGLHVFTQTHWRTTGDPLRAQKDQQVLTVDVSVHPQKEKDPLSSSLFSPPDAFIFAGSTCAPVCCPKNNILYRVSIKSLIFIFSLFQKAASLIHLCPALKRMLILASQTAGLLPPSSSSVPRSLQVKARRQGNRKFQVWPTLTGSGWPPPYLRGQTHLLPPALHFSL